MIQNPATLAIGIALLSFACARAAPAPTPQPSTVPTASPAFRPQQSGTTAALRGIASIDGTVAWASGTEGTVLKTTDGGEHWIRCARPGGDSVGETLDFRAVQAWDASTAIVLAAGPGDKSRIYKTDDGCGHWALLSTNPEPDGFYDGLLFVNRQRGLVLGDPVGGAFRMLATGDGGATWWPVVDPGLGQSGVHLAPMSGEAFFAASNSSMAWTATAREGSIWIGTSKSRVLRRAVSSDDFNAATCDDAGTRGCAFQWTGWASGATPIHQGGESAGIFSVAFRSAQNGVVMGGDYKLPALTANTAAWTSDGGAHWTASEISPRGFRSAVQWSVELRAWIAAGSSGSEISRDDGRTWQPLDDGGWNALSLPFIVGPKGRIARLPR